MTEAPSDGASFGTTFHFAQMDLYLSEGDFKNMALHLQDGKAHQVLVNENGAPGKPLVGSP